MAPGKSLLIVEDDTSIRLLLEEWLSLEGYSILTAENGVEALELIRSASKLPDIILLDLMMPLMNGWELRSELRKNPRWAVIPLVVMTAGTTFEKPGDRSLSAFAYLRKPLEMRSLLSALRKCVPEAVVPARTLGA